MSDQIAASAETKTIDLMPFCDPDPDSRYAFQKPWLDGDQVIATDGRALIVCDPTLYTGKLADDEARRPGWRQIMDPLAKVDTWLPLPTYPECGNAACRGTGEFSKKCQSCHGYGEHRCECGNEHECDRCEGKGETVELCEVCDCNFGNRHIACRLANRLLPLPQTEWGVVTNDPTDVVYFRFAGGMGAVMPMKPREER